MKDIGRAIRSILSASSLMNACTVFAVLSLKNVWLTYVVVRTFAPY